MSTYSWRTNRDGYVEVDVDGSGEYQAIEIQPDTATKRVLSNWIPLAQKNSVKHRVPVSWILAFIYSETGGDPNAENECCAGLMAIYYSIHGMTRDQALDPETNVDKATSWIAESVKKGLDLPQSASVHNAGGGITGTPHPSSRSPWGMRENEGAPYGFIERVVRAQNYFRRILENSIPDYEIPPVEGSALSKLVPFAAGAAFGYVAIDTITKLANKYSK
jgi:soluble lytic murein transglycosylase-like protein